MEQTRLSTTLVCGVDDSRHAADVVAFARALAERLGLRLRLVHGSHGDGFVELLLRALDDGAALAVIGSQGRGPGRAALLGSTSDAIAHASPCPVIVVPPGASIELGDEPTVVCGVDGSAGANVALEHAGSLAHALGGRLMAVHVRPDALAPHATSLMPGRQPFSGSLEDPRTATITIQHPLARIDVDVPVGTRIETGPAAARLRAVAAGEPSAILVVGTRGQGPIRSVVFGSVSARLAAAAPVPVMIVPDPARRAAGRHAVRSGRPRAPRRGHDESAGPAGAWRRHPRR